MSYYPGKGGSDSQVWKFVVPPPNVGQRCQVTMPRYAVPLSVGMQDDTMVVWALVDPDQRTEERDLIVANTGDTIPNMPAWAHFLGTVTTANGVVWHVWAAMMYPPPFRLVA